MTDAPQPGIVHIIGAGPGDPRLITVRGRELIESADAIVFDGSVSRALLPPGAREAGHPQLFDVGRPRGRTRRPAGSAINELLIRLAREGKRVARLTGGDPFVFGRGAEEAQALNDASVAFEIVPGVTAGTAAGAYAGIPVTHRGFAGSVTFLSSSQILGKPPGVTDVEALVKTGGTIVVYSAARSVSDVATALIEAGMRPEVPAALVQHATRLRQRTLTATLGSIAEKLKAPELTAPSVIIAGWTVVLRDELAWFEQLPLFGRRLIVAGSGRQSEGIARGLRDLGARVTGMPAESIARLDLSPLRDELARLAEYSWIVFASAPAVTIFWEQLLGSGRDARALAGSSVAAVGAETAGALLEHGITVDVIPQRFSAEDMLEKLAARDDVAGARALCVMPEVLHDDLPRELESLGLDVTAIHAYRPVQDARAMNRIRRLIEQDKAQGVVFTTAHAVHQFARAVGHDLAIRSRAASISPQVSEAAAAAGMEILCEAEEATPHSLLVAIERALK